MGKPIVLLAVVLGVLLVVFAVIYFSMSANSLPSFLPGYEAGVLKHHYKHGIGALLLGLLCFAFAWFNSGKKST